jgi:hypothetical protein
MVRCLSPALLLLLLAGTAAGQAKKQHQPFTCYSRQPTLREEIESATLVIHGVFLKPGRINNTDEWMTPIEIKTIFKRHAVIDKAKHINLRRELDPQDKNYLIFADVFKNEVDPYRGVPATAAIIKYVHDIIGLKGKKEDERLRFYFEHLEHKDTDVADDAYREFADVDVKHLALLAKNLAADRIAAWLDNIRKTGKAKHRAHLYAHLLGLTGQSKHAPLLKKMIDAKDEGWPIDGLLLGYTLLLPKEGWQTVEQVAKNKDENEANFFRRFGALRAGRYVREYYPASWSNEKRDSLNVFLNQDDMADLWITELRKMKAWDLSGRVLDLLEAKPAPNKITKRAILYFALRSTAMRAQAFMREQRRLDPEFIRECEELLNLEEPPER